jgi:hypothetical protein
MSGAVCNIAARITEEIESVLIPFAAFAGWCAHLSTTGCEVKAARQYESSGSEEILPIVSRTERYFSFPISIAAECPSSFQFESCAEIDERSKIFAAVMNP